jgi:transketolase
MAMGHRHQEIPLKTYVLLGDGELQEGEVWEAALCAGHYQLGNLCALIDYNKMQSDDLNEKIIGLEPLADKWKAFRWQVFEIDGHDFGQIASAMEEADQNQEVPSVIIAHTIKGKGVSYMEGSPAWHGSVKLRDQELEKALRDLGLSTEQIERSLNGTIWKR